MRNVQKSVEFFTVPCPSLLNQFHLKSFLPDWVNNNEFSTKLSQLSCQRSGPILPCSPDPASLIKALLEFFLDEDKLPMGGNFPDKTLINTTSGINNLSSSLMQADNSQEGGKQSSSEVTSSGDISSRGFSFESLDKLLEERNKALSEAKKFLEETGNSAQPQPPTLLTGQEQPSSTVPVTDAKKKEILKHLMEIRFKQRQAFRSFLDSHYSILSPEYFAKEITPLTELLDASWSDLITKLQNLPGKDPNFLKKQFDLENSVFKYQAEVSLKIEKILFDEMAKQGKQGRLPKGFLADYKKDMQKAWIRERESFMAEQKKLKKEVGEIINKKD